MVIQRPSCKQQLGIRPVNSGSPAITDIDAMEMRFDNYFNPVSNIYPYVNDMHRHRKREKFIANQGTGIKCFTPKVSVTNSATDFSLVDQKFEDMFNPITNIYLRTHTLPHDRTQLVPFAKQGTGSLNICKTNAHQKLNNAINDFEKDELCFDIQQQHVNRKKKRRNICGL